MISANSAASEASKIFASFLAAFASTAILAAPRAPGSLSAAQVCCLFAAALVFFAPAAPGFRLMSAPAAAFTCGEALALAMTHSWIVAAVGDYSRWSRVTVVAALVFAAIVVAAGRVALLVLAGKLSRRIGHPIGIILAGALVAIADTAVHRALTWFEPITLSEWFSDLPGALTLVRAGGLEIECGVIAALAIAAVNRSIERVVRVGVAAIVMAVALRGRPAEGASFAVAGLQLDPPESSADFRAERVRQLVAAEPAGASLVVWPEGAYPYHDAMTDAPNLEHLPCSTEHDRIIGMVVRVGRGRFRNLAVAQPRCGRGNPSWRSKELPAPFREAEMLDTTPIGLRVLTIGEARVAVPICYEILDRRFLADSEAELVVNISADGFDLTGVASRYLSRAARLRATEIGVPVVRVSDHGYSAAFDGNGGVVRALDAQHGVLYAWLSLR